MSTRYITRVPNTNVYVDEGYNLCNKYGEVYTYQTQTNLIPSSTIPLNSYLQGLKPLFRRQGPEDETPAYPDGGVPPASGWGEMQDTWYDRNIGTCFGIKDSFLYVRGMNGEAKPAPGSQNVNRMVFLCKADWAKNGNRILVTMSPSRLSLATSNMYDMAKTIPSGVPKNVIGRNMLRGFRQPEMRQECP